MTPTEKKNTHTWIATLYLRDRDPGSDKLELNANLRIEVPYGGEDHPRVAAIQIADRAFRLAGFGPAMDRSDTRQALSAVPDY